MLNLWKEVTLPFQRLILRNEPKKRKACESFFDPPFIFQYPMYNFDRHVPQKLLSKERYRVRSKT
jgi:hypothetical protein